MNDEAIFSMQLSYCPCPGNLFAYLKVWSPIIMYKKLLLQLVSLARSASAAQLPRNQQVNVKGA